MLQHVEQLGGTPLENTPEVSWNQRPADGWKVEKKNIVSTSYTVNNLRHYIKRNTENDLTVSFGSIFQTEGDREHGVILKKFCGEGIPPEIVTVLCTRV